MTFKLDINKFLHHYFHFPFSLYIEATTNLQNKIIYYTVSVELSTFRCANSTDTSAWSKKPKMKVSVKFISNKIELIWISKMQVYLHLNIWVVFVALRTIKCFIHKKRYELSMVMNNIIIKNQNMLIHIWKLKKDWQITSLLNSICIHA